MFLFSFQNVFYQSLYRCARLTHLRAGSLAGLGRLRTLSIRDAGLVHLHHAALSHLSHLEELYLRNNQLADQVRAAAYI